MSLYKSCWINYTIDRLETREQKMEMVETRYVTDKDGYTGRSDICVLPEETVLVITAYKNDVLVSWIFVDL